MKVYELIDFDEEPTNVYYHSHINYNIIMILFLQAAHILISAVSNHKKTYLGYLIRQNRLKLGHHPKAPTAQSPYFQHGSTLAGVPFIRCFVNNENTLNVPIFLKSDSANDDIIFNER